MATGYRGTNGAKTTDSRGFAFVKKVRFTRTSVQGGDIYGNYCSALGGWYSYAGSWYDDTQYMTSGDYYSSGSIGASGRISDYGHVVGSVTTYTYWTVTTQDVYDGSAKICTVTINDSHSANIDAGSTFTVSATPSSGYVVTSIGGVAVSSYATGTKTQTFTADGDMTVTATVAKYCTISFNRNGHGTAPSSIGPLVAGDTYTLPSMSATGWHFKGWTQGTSSTPIYPAGSSFTVGGTPVSYTYKAQWEQFTLTYDANGGSTPPSDQVYYGDVTIGAAVSMSGRAFGGWMIDGVVCQPGATYNLTSDKTATAVWDTAKLTIACGANIQRVYYKVNGASSFSNTTSSVELDVYKGSTWYAYAVADTGYTPNAKDPNGNPAVDANHLYTQTMNGARSVTFTAALNKYTVTLTKGAHITDIYYRIGSSGGYTKLTGTTVSNISHGSKLYAYAVAENYYEPYATQLSPAEYTVNQAFSVEFKAKPIRYGLTLQLGTGVAKIYHKVNGATSWTGTTSAVTLQVDYASTWYAYTDASTGYTSRYTSSSPLERTKNAEAQSVTFTNIPNTYTVKKAKNDGSGGYWNDQSATFDAAFSASAPSRTGYWFKGWYVTAGLNASTAKYGSSAAGATNAITSATTLCKNGEPSGTVYFKNLTAVANGTATITAQWQPNTYEVAFDASPGTPSTPSKTVTYDSTYGDLPTATRTGYTFDGWYTGSGGTGTKITPSTTVKITANQTLYAKWTAKQSALTFNANGGSGTMPTGKTATYGQAMPTYGQSAPTRTGYTFAGYYDTSAATGGTQYYTASLASARNWDKNTTSGTTLYARWTVNTYTVTLDRQDGTGGSGSVTATYDAAMPSATMPIRYGYNFGGYYSGKNGSGTQYYTAQGASARTWNIASATTLYAKWTAKSVTVSFGLNNPPDGVTQPPSKTVTYGGTYGTLPTFSPSGANFVGWWTASSGGTQTTSASPVTNASAHTLYARWSNPWVANITYVLDGGTAGSGSPTTSAYTGVTPIPAPTKSHFRFKGWKVSGDLSPGAKWGKTNSSVTTAITTSSVLIGNSYGDPVYVTNLASKNNASITLTATWQKITYSVKVTKSNADFTVANTSYNLNLSGSTTSQTISVDAGVSFSLWAAMVYSSFKQMQVARPYSVNGTSQSNNKFSRNGVTSGNRAMFLFTHTFGDSEAASQTWKITAQTVKVTYGAKSGTTIPAGWISELGNPTIQFADTTGTNVKITPPGSAKIESVDHGSARVSPSGYYVSSDSESITVATDKSGDTAPQKNGIAANLTYDLTRIDVNTAFDSGSAAYAAAAGWSVAVAGGDTATHRQIGYGESATVSITAPQSTVAEFVGWFRNGALVSSSATYELTNVTSDTTLYAKLRVPVSVRIKYENDIGPETTFVAVKEPGSPSYSEVETPPRTFKVTLGEKFSVRAMALVEPAHFSGWHYYSGSDEQPLGAPTGFAPEQEITATDATNNIVARFTNRANLYYVAVYSRIANTGAFTQDCVFTANNKDGSAGNQNIVAISRSDYKAATQYVPEDEKNGGTAKDNVRFFEVTDIQRLVVSAAVDGAAPALCSFLIKKMPNGVETRISERAEFQSVVNGDYAYILDIGDNSRATIAVSTTLDTSVANPKVMGTVRVGSEGRDIVVTERVDGRIIGEQGNFVLGRTATIYAFAENGYKFVGWYDNDEMTGTPVSKEAVYSFTMQGSAGSTYTYYAKFVRASYALYEWEGSDENKLMTWRSKVYELSKPANLTSVRVDTQKYPVARFKSESFSAPDAAPTRTVDFATGNARLASQTMRRLPQRRPERYFQVEVQNDAEVDAIIIGTSGEGLAT